MNDIKRMTTVQIKALRRDARKLDTIAKHLRQEATDLTRQLKADERAEKARTNFFSKTANVDGATVLTPDPPQTEDFTQGETK